MLIWRKSHSINNNSLVFGYYNKPLIGPFWTSYWIYLFKSKVRYIILIYMLSLGFPGGSDGKESACSVGDPSSIPGSGRSPGEGNGNPLQYSCLKTPMNGGVWQAIVHEVAKSQTRLSDFICFLLVKKQSPCFSEGLEMVLVLHKSNINISSRCILHYKC